MNKKTKIIFLAIIITLTIILIQSDFKLINAQENNKIDNKIIEEFNSGKEKVKVIINVNENITEKVFFGIFTKTKKVNRTNLIKETKIQEKVKHQYTYNNGFSAELTQEEIQELINKNEIQSINYDYPVKAFLQDSIDIINATQTWTRQISGTNLTGDGQIVCIIDTGADYNHSNLGDGWGNKIIAGYNALTGQNCSTNNSACMDDHGHGTHVAGIVAANGTLKGIAPNADLIIIKALNAEGGGDTSNLIDAIDWCTSYSENTQNITAISMSLGGGQYTTDCNSQNPSLATSINNAISKNISVIAATGNTDESQGLTNPVAGISSPACISNVIKVTAVDKLVDESEDYASYAFRYSNFPEIISAPGSLINSTYPNENYATSSGTSMATPMVAGAIAIINQYYELQEQQKTPEQIHELLNNTGKEIYDSLSDETYTRINLFSTLDTAPPQIQFTTGTEDNNTNFSRDWIYINISLTEVNLKNITYSLYNNTNIVNSTNYNQSISSINWTDLNPGIYFYNVTAYDNANNYNSTQTRKITIDALPPQVTLMSPEDNFVTNLKVINFTANFTNLNLKNTTFYLWNLTNQIINQTTKNITGQENQTTIEINLTDKEYGDYKWNYLACDQLDICGFANTNYTITISDINLKLIQPQDNYYTNINQTNFICNASSLSNNLTNMTFNLWDSNSLVNYSTQDLSALETTEFELNISYNFTQENDYIWGCIAYNQEDYFNEKNYTITFDITEPQITLNIQNITTTSATLEINSTEEINYTIENQEGSFENSTYNRNHSITLTGLEQDTTYTFNVLYCDKSNNCGALENQQFTTEKEETTSSPSGGSSSSSTSTVSPTTETTYSIGTKENPINSTKLIQGYSTEIKINKPIFIQNSKNKNHSITLSNIVNKTAVLIIQSEPIIINLKENQTKLLSLESPYFYDLKITLTQLEPTPKLQITEINFPTNYVGTPKYNDTLVLEDEEPRKIFNIDIEKIKLIIFITLTIIFIILIIILLKSILTKNEI